MHKIVNEDLQAILEQPLNWELLRGKSILVTGANGFLPAYMIESILRLNDCAQLGCNVVGVVRNTKKTRARFADYLERRDLTFINSDVSEPFQCATRCEIIVHAASQASPKFFGPDPVGTMAANVIGTHHLLKLAKIWECERFLLFSSGEVYGSVDIEKVPTREQDYGYIEILDKRSCYAESKRAAETLLVSYVSQFQIPGVIVRPFHTYGPGMSLDDGRVYADFVRSIVNKLDIVMTSNGDAVRAFCYLSDAVSGFFTVLLNGCVGQAYNVGNPNGAVSIRELANMLVAMHPDLGLKVICQPSAGSDYLPSSISINSPNIDRIAQLGWRPSILPCEGFERTIRYYLNS